MKLPASIYAADPKRVQINLHVPMMHKFNMKLYKTTTIKNNNEVLRYKM